MNRMIEQEKNLVVELLKIHYLRYEFLEENFIYFSSMELNGKVKMAKKQK